ncbi:hypothetical protein [Fusobacterium sp. oral taxon 203]|uniref:hypothetical protein n=1 Tax=Fusobacterium sp. oral taxon 203 TaxID=671211 RepID=UPI000B92618A|nr:hypothetical protein [Fusobacterium sp. oral taxon 203]ASS38777.1 hypothetical protein AXF16_01060 [Fusobacterium sp. oral taxon 203]
MFEDKNVNLIANIISILENREDTWYFELRKKNSNSLAILKEWCRLNNFNYININNYPVLSFENNFYLIYNLEIDGTGNFELLIEEYNICNKYRICQIRKVEKPIITSTKKLYSFIKNIKKELVTNFIEKIKIEDIVYCSNLDKYYILSNFKNNLRNYSKELEGIKISVINLFFGKSPYLFKGNEVNTIEELMLLKERSKWKSFSQL